MSACRAVIFDLDGVILDSERVAMGRWKQVGEALGLDGIEEVYIRCIGTTPSRTREILEEAYGPTFSHESFYALLSTQFRRGARAQMPVKSGSREILEALKNAGLTLAVASSSPEDYVRRELEGAGLLAFFDHVVTGDMVTHSKPDPEIFRKAGALCGAAPEEIWVIEDSFNGIRAAHAAKMRPLMVPDMVPPDEEMRDKAHAILPDLLAARDYILENL